jgi:hypothetical protein
MEKNKKANQVGRAIHLQKYIQTMRESLKSIKRLHNTMNQLINTKYVVAIHIIE